MRLWMLLGGLIGFLTGLGLGIARENAWPTIIWRASATACLAGMVLRWWGGVWIRSLHDAQNTPEDDGGTASGKGKTSS
jgi:hypothetical protein